MAHRLTRDEILEQVSQIVGDTIDVEGLALQPSMTATDVAGNHSALSAPLAIQTMPKPTH